MGHLTTRSCQTRQTLASYYSSILETNLHQVEAKHSRGHMHSRGGQDVEVTQARWRTRSTYRGETPSEAQVRQTRSRSLAPEGRAWLFVSRPASSSALRLPLVFSFLFMGLQLGCMLSPHLIPQITRHAGPCISTPSCLLSMNQLLTKD